MVWFHCIMVKAWPINKYDQRFFLETWQPWTCQSHLRIYSKLVPQSRPTQKLWHSLCKSTNFERIILCSHAMKLKAVLRSSREVKNTCFCIWKRREGVWETFCRSLFRPSRAIKHIYELVNLSQVGHVRIGKCAFFSPRCDHSLQVLFFKRLGHRQNGYELKVRMCWWRYRTLGHQEGLKVIRVLMWYSICVRFGSRKVDHLCVKDNACAELFSTQVQLRALVHIRSWK